MLIKSFNLQTVHPSWQSYIAESLTTVDAAYLSQLSSETNWLPGADKIFNAFSIPLIKVNYVLFGESPYPRKESANGYAFWDAAVQALWSPTGLHKAVNRATSLRNFIKMLLVAEELLDKKHVTQETIARLNKEKLVQHNADLFRNLLSHGFLLLNASLVLQPQSPLKDAKAWRPFLEQIIDFLVKKNPNIQFILFGNIAKRLEPILKNYPSISVFYAEHPYNHTFIENTEVINFFRPLHLLLRNVS